MREKLERLREALEKRTVKCQDADGWINGLHTWHEGTLCFSCRGTGHTPDPTYAQLLNVVRDICPSEWCPAGIDPALHDPECTVCGDTGYVTRTVWEELRAQGVQGALAEALAVATKNLPIGRWNVPRDNNSDEAALDAILEALEVTA